MEKIVCYFESLLIICLHGVFVEVSGYVRFHIRDKSQQGTLLSNKPSNYTNFDLYALKTLQPDKRALA